MGKSDFWTVIGAVVAVVAIGLAVLFFILNQTSASKSLEVELVAMTSFTSSDLDLGPVEMWVTYKGEQIASYANIQVRVANTGGTPIRKDDYESPLTLDFENVKRILSARELASNPTEINAEPQIEGATNVVLPRILLNSGDWYTIEIELEALPDSTLRFDPIARIAGVGRIMYKDQPVTVRETRTTTRTRARASSGFRITGLIFTGIGALLFMVQLVMPERRLTNTVKALFTALGTSFVVMGGLLIMMMGSSSGV